MKQFVKNILVVGITTALSLVSTVQAVTYKYKVVDKGAVDDLKYTYAQQQNNNGVVAISGTNRYEFPVQYQYKGQDQEQNQNQYLDDDDFQEIKALAERGHDAIHALEVIEDYDEMAAGNPSANDLAWIVLYLQGKSNVSSLNTVNIDTIKGSFESVRKNYYYQQVGDTVAMINLGAGDETAELPLFDQAFDGTDALTRSTVDIITGVTDNGIAYGSFTPPYLPMVDFTESNGEVLTYWLREFEQRGFFSFDNGEQVFQVVPEESSLGGGISAVLDVNENATAVGYMSYELNQDVKDLIENGNGGCGEGITNEKGEFVPNPTLKDMPPEICEQILRTSMYPIMAYSATLDTSGEIVTKRLGLLIDKSNQSQHPDDDRAFSSYALAVNDNGVAVGYADGWDDGNESNPAINEEMSGGNYAVMFKDGEVFDFNQEHFDFNREFSKAIDINDNGLAVGYIYNNSGTKKFFYVDTSVNEDEMEIITPDDFFGSSDSTAHAVNNAGFIVGEGEIETHNDNSTPRRTAAFIYDKEKDDFSNLNDLTACDSPYTIIEARDINDEGVISATAIFKEDRFDAKGVLVEDDNGDPVKEDVVRAVVLEPIADDGEVCPEKEEDKVERQGASFGLFGLFSLLALIALRRRTT